MPTTRPSRIAEFVRGYFVWLESNGVAAAVLHGWEDCFEGEISDIDYVMDAAGFREVTRWVHLYCAERGWRLCQVLRHEGTAAFCVCSALDDPACVVALDACSDYRRNGRLLLRAADLLEGRQRLGWGGFRLDPAKELRYRFIKAAAKGKEIVDIVPRLLAMEPAAREGIPAWLRSEWNVPFSGWSDKELGATLARLTLRCGPAATRLRPSEFRRLARRVIHPDGLLLILGVEQERNAEAIGRVFSGLYFRRHKMVSEAKPAHRMDLIRSTLVISSAARASTRLGVGADGILDISAAKEIEDVIEEIAEFLHRRCLKRVGIVVTAGD
jgi:hypothetical protein